MRSFENEISHLNPKIKFLADPNQQIPSHEKPVWYMPVQLGHNPIKKFMGRLPDQCGLSDHYTNHCIRVMGVTNLACSGRFTAKQIMSVMGHKSIQSLAMSQRVHADENLIMGMNLTYCLVNPFETEGICELIQK